MKSPINIMKRICLLLTVLLLGTSARATAESEKLNICLILADDWRADCMGLLGHELVKTPNLDRLCRDGFIFRNAYVLGGDRGAVCMPSRTMIQTGVSYMREQISTPTLAETVKAAGYASIRSGKHGNNPNNLDKVFDQHPTSHQSAATHADNIIGFIQENAGKKPLFLYFAPVEPHYPHAAPKEYHAHYQADEIPMPPNFMPMHPFDNGEMLGQDEQLVKWPRTQKNVGGTLARYYASIEYMDAQAGRIIEALKQAGQFENTIFVVAGDNGMAMGAHGLIGKQNLYELGGMHVPLLFAGPGVPKGDTDAFAHLYDIYPTMCHLAGIEVPAGLDAKDLSPVIQGEQPKVRDTLFTAYIDGQRSIRDERWKLIRYPLINKTQLFDLEADPYELNDLSTNPEHEGRIAELSALLETTRKGYGDTDPIMVENPQPEEWSLPAVIPSWGEIERSRNRAKAAAKAAGKAIPAFKPIQQTGPHPASVEIETASEAGGFSKFPLPKSASGKVTANQNVVKPLLGSLVDGKIAEDFGPIFNNGVESGAYKMDLGRAQPVAAVTSWSYNKDKHRGAQKIVLYGSNSATDPGWDLAKFTALGTIDTTGGAKAKFTAASLRAPAGRSLGQFRWILWAVYPVTERGGGEHTAFQELAVELR
ncbi:sulfatase-like hydrolase/transferase [Coraliomargarita algicola]|uniref:Sulfatase-like hydrolase/transferase n=1 Tax=Coraliomargarita algicola TaxID=3092156 RepID=A0ABZ0RPW6_9BACT|nr:sulfatase-like hydrolase/transferase [Coraliomargarita sp. J2-16]WPJ97284.1 sulfatase-like hydrolase/transferase [Coraliomargarita sp. J2-16]